MYLLVSKDLEIYKTRTLKKIDFEDVDEGLLDIIDMDNETIYIAGKWMEIDELRK